MRPLDVSCNDMLRSNPFACTDYHTGRPTYCPPVFTLTPLVSQITTQGQKLNTVQCQDPSPLTIYPTPPHIHTCITHSPADRMNWPMPGKKRMALTPLVCPLQLCIHRLGKKQLSLSFFLSRGGSNHDRPCGMNTTNGEVWV